MLSMLLSKLVHKIDLLGCSTVERSFVSGSTAKDVKLILEHADLLRQTNTGINCSVLFLQKNRILPLIQEHGRGILIMADSGAYTLFAKAQKLSNLPDGPQKKRIIKGLEKQRNLFNLFEVPHLFGCEYRLEVNFEGVFEAFENLLCSLPHNNVILVAPDSIGDPQETRIQQGKYLPRIKELTQKYGAEWIVPCQVASAQGFAETYQWIRDNNVHGTVGIPIARFRSQSIDHLVTEVTRYLLDTVNPKDGIRTHFLGLGNTKRIKQLLTRFSLIGRLKYLGQLFNMDWWELIDETNSKKAAAKLIRLTPNDLINLEEEVLSKIMGDLTVAEQELQLAVIKKRAEDEEFDDTENWDIALEEYWESQGVSTDTQVQKLVPFTCEDPNLFYRSITELLCSVDSSKVFHDVIHGKWWDSLGRERANPEFRVLNRDNQVRVALQNHLYFKYAWGNPHFGEPA